MISRPMGGAVKGKAEEQHIGGGKECRFREECAGQKADDEHGLEYCRKPGEESENGNPAAAI